MTVVDPQHFSAAAHFSEIAGVGTGTNGIPASPRVVFCGEPTRRKAVPIENEPKKITTARPSRFPIPSRSAVRKGNQPTAADAEEQQHTQAAAPRPSTLPETQVSRSNLATMLATAPVPQQQSSSFNRKDSSIENLRFVRDESILGLHKLTQIPPQSPSEPSTPLKLQQRASKKDGKSSSSGVRGKQQDRTGGQDYDQEVPRQGIPLSPEVIFSAGMTAIPVAVYEALAAQQAAENSKSGVVKSLVRWWRGRTHSHTS